jgi:hypothetical protein
VLAFVLLLAALAMSAQRVTGFRGNRAPEAVVNPDDALPGRRKT